MERREGSRDVGTGVHLRGGESNGPSPGLGSKLLGSNPKFNLLPGETLGLAPRPASGLRRYPVQPRKLAPEGMLQITWPNPLVRRGRQQVIYLPGASPPLIPHVLPPPSSPSSLLNVSKLHIKDSLLGSGLRHDTSVPPPCYFC